MGIWQTKSTRIVNETIIKFKKNENINYHN